MALPESTWIGQAARRRPDGRKRRGLPIAFACRITGLEVVGTFALLFAGCTTAGRDRPFDWTNDLGGTAYVRVDGAITETCCREGVATRFRLDTTLPHVLRVRIHTSSGYLLAAETWSIQWREGRWVRDEPSGGVLESED